MESAVPLPPQFTLLQVVPELETGGAEQTTLDIAAAVTKAGGRALVASRGGRMVARLEDVGGELVQMPAHSKNLFVIAANAVRLARLIRAEKVSLVHARSRAPAFSALLAARATGAPFVATYHGVYKAKSALKRWYNSVMTRGDLVIANSDYTRVHLLAEHRIDRSKVVTIPRGVELSRFDPGAVTAARVRTLEKAWGLTKDGRTRFLLAGRLTRIKGHLSIVEAARRLKAQGKHSFVVLFAGDDQGRTGYAAEVHAAIDKAELQQEVRIVGHCDDMPAAYLLADVAILPTIVPESFGRAAVEPQVMGRPVIASAHGGVTETVVHGETGWLTPVDDAQAWFEAMAAAIEVGPKARTGMGRAGQARARRLYSVDAMTAATLAAYDRVLEART
jgi:glycosyltransferase involved in cell wall biosynthesis